MQWIAPSVKAPGGAALEQRLWAATDQFRANSGLKSQEYSASVLGLSYKASKHHAKLAANSAKTFADFVFDSYSYQKGAGKLK